MTFLTKSVVIIIKGKNWIPAVHSKFKANILSKYLRIWFTYATGKNHHNAIYIDGFAGPGRLKKTESSPEIAIEQAVWALKRHQNSRIIMNFIEKDLETYKHLCENLKAHLQCHCKKNQIEKLKENIKIIPENKGFSDSIEEFLKGRSMVERRYLPIFAFIDPFNLSVSLNKIIELTHFNNSEILLNLCVIGISRNKDDLSKEKQIKIFGGELNLEKMTTEEIIDHYKKVIKESTDAFALSFDVYNSKNRHQYSLIFLTKNRDTIEKMKGVMFNTCTEIGLTFTNKNQKSLEENTLFSVQDLQKSELKSFLVKQYSRQTVAINELFEKIAYSDEFIWDRTRIRHALDELETENQITVFSEKPTRRKKTYPDGTLIRFF